MIERLDLQDNGDLVLVRGRVWKWLRTLGLDPMVATRLATATSEVARRRLESGPVTLHIELATKGLQITLDQAGWFEVASLLRGARVRDDTLVVAVRSGALAEVRERVTMGQSLQVNEREREQARRAAAEMAAQLDRANRELTRQQEALRRVNADLEMISAAVAHDLRQPLHAVSMFGAVLLASEDTKTIGEQVKGAADRMSAMLEGLMQLARIGEAEYTTTRVSRALGEVLSDLSSATHTYGAVVTRQGDGEVALGEAHLRVILQNLINNAMKYHREGVPPVIDVRISVRGSRTEIAVVDNGRGLRRSDLRKVTRLFKRLDRDRADDGAGVGLALVQRVVDGYGGELGIRSNGDDPGTTVVVELPSA